MITRRQPPSWAVSAALTDPLHVGDPKFLPGQADDDIATNRAHSRRWVRLCLWDTRAVTGLGTGARERIEPLTCRLQEACSHALDPLPAPMPHESATTAPKTLGFSVHPFHDPFHACGSPKSYVLASLLQPPRP